jgi:hypothetical protein
VDLEKLEKMAKVVLNDLSSCSDPSVSIRSNDTFTVEFRNLMNVALQCLPAHEHLFTSAYNRVGEIYGLRIHRAVQIIEHLLEIIEIEKAGIEKTHEGMIFETAEEKMKQVGLSFRRGDYVSAFHNLNTVLELVLKDKLGIPTTITSINTSTIIDILIKHKVDCYLYFAEAKKHVLMIDNKIKHQSYSPSKTECINGIRAIEDLVSKLRDRDIEIIEDVKDKIFEGL